MTFKRLICNIFGHQLGRERYEGVEYVTTSCNYQRGLRKTTKKHRKKKVVRVYRRCRRCGAMILIYKYKENR